MSVPPVVYIGSRKGLALIVVVYILAALGTLAFALACRSGIGLCQTRLLVDRTQQDEIALAACAQACRLLLLDDPNVDSYEDAWSGWHALEMSQSPGGAAEAPSWKVRWRLRDESARINVNSASSDVLSRIAGLDDAAVASILDWIDKDDVPNPDGAEKEYYASLSPSYTPRNGPLETIEELTLIKGVTPESYFGTEPQESLDDLVLGPTLAVGNGTLGGSVGLSELLTVYGDGRINLNTALPAVLKALPFLSESAIDEILSRQQSRIAKFTAMKDIQTDDAFTATDKIVLTQVAKFNSSHFELQVRMQSEGTSSTHEYTAVIEREGNKVRILNWQRKLPRVSQAVFTGS